MAGRKDEGRKEGERMESEEEKKEMRKEQQRRTNTIREREYIPTRTLAAGLSTPILLRIVAPSFVTWIPALCGPCDTKTLS